MRGWVSWALLLLAARLAHAEATWWPETQAWWRDHVTLTANLRLRGEFVDWFEPPPDVAPPGVERYDFFASRLRVGARVLFPHVEFGVEVQNTQFANLPDDAVFPAPVGPLGTGAAYFLHTHAVDQGETSLKQGFVTLRRSGFAATLGRFIYRDGLEVVPADATMAEVKRTRIAERLVGPFDFTDIGRAFDGTQLVYDQPSWNATLVGLRPTQGGFEVSSNREVEHVEVAGLALTLKRAPFGPPIDARLFYLFYRDAREQVLKVDNRPLAVREADHEPIDVHTIGAHALTAVDVGPGIADGFVWGLAQSGRWGELAQSAWAFAVEGGYQLPRVLAAPWLRIGIDRSSGDGNPNDNRHGTFFQLLPTARTHAQLPFYNLMNVQDVFASLLLRPHEMVAIRTDYHWLELGNRNDLWYAGGGASNDDLFGYTGAPSTRLVNGVPVDARRNLAHVADVTVTVTPHPRVTVSGYYGHAFGGGVVARTYSGTDTNYGFLEMTLRY